MSLSLANLRAELRTHLGKNSNQLPDADADKLLNRSWWAISAQLRFNEREAIDSFTTTAGTDEYDIPVDSSAIQAVTIQGPDETDWNRLNRIDDWNMFAKKEDSEQDYPTHYSRRNNKFVLWPNPDNEYDVRVKYLRTLDDIQSSGPDAPQEWHEVVLWGAVARGFFADADWTRGNQAQQQQATYISQLDTQETRDREDRSMSGVKVYRRRYP